MTKKSLSEQEVEDILPQRFSKTDVFYRYSIVFFLAFVLIMGSAVVLWYTHKETNDINKAAAISDVEHFATSVSKFRNFYSKVVVPAAKEHGMTITHDYLEKSGRLPLPATFAKDFGHSLSSENSNFSVKLYSDLPFPWRNETLDKFEKDALEELKKNPEKPIWSFETLNGEQVLRYARADVLKESCVSCHNSYPGTPKSDWKEGDVRGVLEVIRPMSGFEFESFGMLKESFLMMLALILSMVILIFFILRKLSSSIKIAYSSYLASEQANKKLTDEIQHREKVSHDLRTSDVKMRAIVNSVQEVIIVIDKFGIINECNNAISRMFGYEVNEVIGENVSMLMTGKHQTNHDKYILDYVESSVGNVMGTNREFYARRKDGEVFPIELFVNDARVDNEIIFTGTIRDITHRKRTEETTAAAHKAAIDSAELKSEFLANMSHEIRTPMNGVIGMTEMLLMSKLDNEQQELAQTVKESAASLLVIINDILDFSKIEAGKLSIKKTDFNLLHMIEASIDLLSKEADRKHVDIAFFVDRKVPSRINGDAGRLRQILINLLNNALKFTDQGHVLLHVTLADKEHLHFAVVDTGMGIAEEDQASLFDMFSQVDGSSSREHGGTGLGLAICKQLVELMGGQIGAKSELNTGSTFWFTIEIDRQEELPKPFIKLPGHVLMLSTSHLLNRYYNQQMQDWGMIPRIVSNLNHLIATLKKEKFHMIALDVDNIFIDSDNPSAFHSILDTIKTYSNEVPIILYANKPQYNRLENLGLEGNVHMIHKPVKHTAVKLLMNHLKNKPHQLANNEKAEVESDDVVPKTESPLKKSSETFSVLLAEDNRVNQMVAVAILGKLGCEVTVASNGKEALDYVKKQMFEAVFMDCQMPEMDGYEASLSIRALDKSHHSQNIPIIAFTANAMKDDDVKCKESGMDDYLSKPIDMDELQVVFDRWKGQMKERKAARLAE